MITQQAREKLVASIFVANAERQLGDMISALFTALLTGQLKERRISAVGCFPARNQQNGEKEGGEVNTEALAGYLCGYELGKTWNEISLEEQEKLKKKAKDILWFLNLNTTTPDK